MRRGRQSIRVKRGFTSQEKEKEGHLVVHLEEDNPLIRSCRGEEECRLRGEGKEGGEKP